jgi:hypothetical protein
MVGKSLEGEVLHSWCQLLPRHNPLLQPMDGVNVDKSLGGVGKLGETRRVIDILPI